MNDTRSARLRRGLIAIAVLALLLGATGWALQRAFPPQRIAALVTAQVSERTGRELRIQGRLDWRLWPSLAVRAEDLELANAPWGSRPQMLRVQHAALKLELWPLLRGRVRIEELALDGVELLLETDAQGQGNWQLPGRGGSAGGAAQPDEAPAVALERLHLGDLRLSYRDGRSARQTALTLQRLELQREAQGLSLDAEGLLAQQHWQADGKLGGIEPLLANQADWPFKLKLRSEGARIDLVGSLLHGAAPRGARLKLDAEVDKVVALTPWLDATASMPLPIGLKSTLRVDSETVHAEAFRLSLAGQALAGNATLRFGDPWRVQAVLSAPTLDFRRLWPASAAAGSATPSRTGKLFDDTPLPLERLPDGWADVDLSVAELLLARAPPLSALQARLTLRPGSLRVEPLGFGLAGGQVRGNIALATAAGLAPRLKLRLDAQGLSAQALSRAAGAGSALGGGQVQLKTDLSMTGRSPRALAADADGEFLLSAQDLRLGDGAGPIGSKLLPQVLDAILPKRRGSTPTRLDCLVVRLPFSHGVAQVDRSIALETPDLAISAIGRIDLRDETMALAFRPTPKRALGLDTAPLASLVVAKGPLLDPQLTLDAKAVAGMALSIGAAVASGGLSMLGQQLLKPASDPHACHFAATGLGAAPKTEAAPAPKARPAPDKVLPELLRRIFK